MIYTLFIVLVSMTLYTRASEVQLKSISLYSDKKVLNPLLHPGEFAKLSVSAVDKNGQQVKLNPSEISFMVKSKLSSDALPVLVLKGDQAFAGEGGLATITVTVKRNTQVFTASTDIVVRPYYREYHQILVMKLMMGMEGEPVERLEKEPLFQNAHDVICTFEQAFDVIRKTDNLTMGIPKIIYLVGWQKGGHDHLYPAWDEVNPRLKRKQDKTALESLNWLIREGRKYHTTVSLHINMADAYKSSPLWNEYLKKDVLARDINGRVLSSSIQIKGDSLYNVSYTREWAEGLAQRRIDRLVEMIPELKIGHTIHIDAFVSKTEFQPTLSPWHAKKENGGIDIFKEAETQHKIFRYWRAKGFDVTGEGLFWAHPPGEGFYGLQPMSWWYPADIGFQMNTPECLSARGRTDRKGDGDFRFGSSMHGEEIFVQDKENLPGFKEQFCRTTLPWFYLSQHSRIALQGDTLLYSEGIKAFNQKGHHLIKQGELMLRDNNDLFVPALWEKNRIIAYSESGYEHKQWVLPLNWQKVKFADLYEITINGPVLLSRRISLKNGKIKLSVVKNQAIYIVPSA
ncbi:hypothetical protein DBR11_08605 [Pedobacter sp. HMWF019]|nr:hypothetical protein DBR11_08605 [Pedobacter sp. HMWF019]